MKVFRNVRTLALLAALACGTLGAEPVLVKQVCPACRGQKSLSLTPPNLGQFDGEIDVTPGRPFTTHRFDVKYKVCPLCEGAGRHAVYRLTGKAPAETELDPCPECRWTGVTPCRKCKGTGYQTCSKCQSGGGKDGKPGWIKTQKSTTVGTNSYNYNRHGGSYRKHTTSYSPRIKILVTPCGTCSGIGRLVCPECQGKGGVLCRKCHGEGGVPKKEKR